MPQIAFKDGFDDYGGSGGQLSGGSRHRWDGVGSVAAIGVGIAARTGHEGKAAATYAGSAGKLRKTLGAASPQLGIGAYVTTNALNKHRRLATWYDGSGTALFTLCFTVGGIMELRAGATTAGSLLGATDEPYLDVNEWRWLEARPIIDGATSSLELRRHKTSLAFWEFDLGSATAAQSVDLWFDDGFVSGYWYWDDFHLLDYQADPPNTWLGPSRVYSRSPLADSSVDTDTDEWVRLHPGNGDFAHHLRINGNFNDHPSDDQQYIHALAIGARALFTIAALPANVTTINSVTLSTRARLESTGDAALVSLLRSGTEEHRFDLELTTAWRWYNRIASLNPDTGESWTPAEIPTALFGVETA